MADLRILDGQVLDTGGVTTGSGKSTDYFVARDWSPDSLSAFAQQAGFGDLWNTGYGTQMISGGFDQPEQEQATYSPELLQKLSEYNFYRTGQRPGETDRARHLVATDKAGNPIWDNSYSYSKWSDAPLDAAKVLGSAYLGASALNGGLLGMGGATGGTAGGAAAAGGLEMSGQMPVYQAMSSSQLPAIAGAGGAAATTIPMGGYAGAGLEGGTMTAGGSGGLLGGTLGKFAPGVAKFITDNPLLAKGLFSAATGLLSASGGGSGGGGEPKFGPAKQWKSPLQQGLIGNPQLTDIAKPVSFKGRW
jgi:hypothetical protein